MYRKFGFILISLFCAISCESEKALTLISQEEQIESYINKEFSEYEIVRNEGTNRIILQQGNPSVLAANGDSLEIIFEGYIFDKAPVELFTRDSAVVALGNGSIIKGLENGLEGAALGEQSIILFSAKYGYYEREVGLVPPMSSLLFNTFIKRIKKN